MHPFSVHSFVKSDCFLFASTVYKMLQSSPQNSGEGSQRTVVEKLPQKVSFFENFDIFRFFFNSTLFVNFWPILKIDFLI